MVDLPPARHAPLVGGASLRWGILAPGQIARDWANAVRTFTEQQIVAVGSRDGARAEQFARRHGIPRSYGSYDALFEDTGVEVVYIAAPHTAHVELAMAAIAAGKHVLVEKPLALSAAEAELLAGAARAADVFIMEAMWTRFLPQTAVIAQLLAEGALGDVRSASADFGSRVRFDPTDRAFDPALGGGGLADLGVYSSWFVHFALGRAESLTAAGTLAATGVDEEAIVLTRHAGGRHGIARSSLRARSPQRATIIGEDAVLDVDAPFWSPGGFSIRTATTGVTWTDPNAPRGRSGLAYEAAAVAAHIADGRREAPEHPMSATVEILRVLETAGEQLKAQTLSS